jgi:hypothetical protein
LVQEKKLEKKILNQANRFIETVFILSFLFTVYTFLSYVLTSFNLRGRHCMSFGLRFVSLRRGRRETESSKFLGVRLS